MKKILKIMFLPFLIPFYILMFPVMIGWRILKFAVFILFGWMLLDVIFGWTD